MDMAPALHFEILLFTLPSEHWSLGQWLFGLFIGWNRIFLLQCFSSTYSEDSFFCIILSSACLGVFLSLENCEEEAEKLIHCCISQEHTTLCNSFHPESSLDTAQQGGCSIPQREAGGRDENWSRGRPSPLMPWAQTSNCRVFSLVIPLTLPKNLPSACGCY